MPAADQPDDPLALITFVTSAADVGRGVEAARKRAGLSQAALARHCGVGRRFVLELESGKASVRLDKTLQVLYGAGLISMVVPVELVRDALGK